MRRIWQANPLSSGKAFDFPIAHDKMMKGQNDFELASSAVVRMTQQKPRLPWIIPAAALALMVALALGAAGLYFFRNYQHERAIGWLRANNIRAYDATSAGFKPPKRGDPVSISIYFASRADVTEVIRHCLSVNNITELTVDNRSLSVQNLTDISCIRTLEHVHLRHCELDEQNIEALTSLPNLQYVGLVDMPCTDAVLDIIARMPHLTTLDVDGTNIGEAQIRQFAQQHPQIDICWSPRLSKAQTERNDRLEERGIYVTYSREDFSILSRNPTNLALRLAVPYDVLDSIDFDKSEVVEFLFISKHAVSDELLQEAADTLPDLKWIDIEGTKYTMNGLKSLLKLQQLKSITYFNGGRFDDAEIDAFKSSFQGTFEPRP